MKSEVLDIFQELKKLNARLYLEDGNVKLDIKRDLLTKEIHNAIKFHKEDILEVLSNHQSELQTIPKAELKKNYPLSLAQKRLWVLSKFKGGLEAYNMANHINLSGKYDIPNLEKAIHSVIERHEILRTVFREDENGTAYQKIIDSSAFDFEITKVDFRENTNAEKATLAYIKQDLYQPFNLSEGPLLRVFLLRLTDRDYILYYNMHHIISDGWSLDILARDILAFYNHYTENESLNIPDLNIQYKDYSAWHFDQLQSGKFSSHNSYWLDKLSDDLPVFNLGTTESRPSIMTYNGHYLSMDIGIKETDAIRLFCSTKGGTLFMFLVTLMRVLFYRYTSEGDLIIGSPVAGRSHESLENQIGFYINTIVFRSKLERGMTFNEVFDLVSEDMLLAYKNQDYPFDKLVKDLLLDRDTSRNALFDVMAVMQNTNGSEQSELNGTAKSNGILSGGHVKNNGEARAKCDMEFSFQEVDGHVCIHFLFNRDIYEVEQMSALLKHYHSLLKSVLKNTNQNIDKLNLLSANERQKLLKTFNDTATEYKHGNTFLDGYYEQMSANPKQIAVVYEDRNLNYGELEELSNQFSNFLQSEFDVIPGDLLAIKLDRSEWMLVSILSVLKLGAAYIPIGMDYPEERIRHIEKDSACKIKITQALIDRFLENRSQYSKERPENQVSLESAVFGIYTSGSTGIPKGVLNTHAGVFNRLQWMKEYLNVGKSDILLQKTPFTFDVSVGELLMPAFVGCRLIFARPEGHKDPNYIQDLIEAQRVTIVHFVPSMLSIFLDHVQAEKCKSLEHIICSGEALPGVSVEVVKEKLPWVQIHNLYGPTEAAIEVSAVNLTEVDTKVKGVSIGKPMANTELYIVDADLSLKPIGVAGELIIGGVQVARGYLNRPQLSVEKFIPNPYRKGENAYRTGDLARWLPNGEVEYIGRIDNQVKLRGNRIELGEVENHIMRTELVDNAAVLIADREDGHKSLIAYVVPKENYTEDELYAYLRSQVPDYMIPAQVVEMESFPLTSSGKVNRKKLPVQKLTFNDDHIEPPNGIVEEQLTELWSQVLDIEKVSVVSNFFRVGGDSILLMRLIIK
ncbi:MAG: amino acid adenylation domain-containing protein [Bacteroidota bacterium]